MLCQVSPLCLCCYVLVSCHAPHITSKKKKLLLKPLFNPPPIFPSTLLSSLALSPFVLNHLWKACFTPHCCVRSPFAACVDSIFFVTGVLIWSFRLFFCCCFRIEFNTIQFLLLSVLFLFAMHLIHTVCTMRFKAPHCSADISKGIALGYLQKKEVQFIHYFIIIFMHVLLGCCCCFCRNKGEEELCGGSNAGESDGPHISCTAG